MEKIVIKTYEDYENDERELMDDPIYDSPYFMDEWDSLEPFTPEALVAKYKKAGFTFNTDTVTVYKILGEDIWSMYDEGEVDWEKDVSYIKADTVFYVLKSSELGDDWRNRGEQSSDRPPIFFRVWSKLLDMIDDAVEDEDGEDDDE
jgi:hypothetical protein